MNSTKYNEEFVKKLIRSPEGNRLDFKQKITSKEKIAKTLSAFGNSEGGYILIGVTDQKRVLGIDVEEEKYMISSANEEHCFPKVSLTFFPIPWKGIEENLPDQEEDIYVLLVEVKATSGPRIYCKTNSGEIKAYQRIGDQTLAI